MGGATPFLETAKIGMGVYQDVRSSKGQSYETEANAADLEGRAARKEMEASEALRMGELEMAEQRAKGRVERARTRAGYAASGVKVDEGSTAEVVADKAAWNEYERQKIGHEADLKSWGLNYDASLLRRDAVAARATANGSGVNWFGTASRVMDDFGKI